MGEEPPSPQGLPPLEPPHYSLPQPGQLAGPIPAPSIIQAAHPLLSFSEKLCVSTGVAGVFAPETAPVPQRGKENADSERIASQAQPRVQERAGGRQALGAGQVAAQRARTPASPGRPPLPGKEARRGRPEVGQLPPSLGPSLPSFLPSFLPPTFLPSSLFSSILSLSPLLFLQPPSHLP